MWRKSLARLCFVAAAPLASCAGGAAPGGPGFGLEVAPLMRDEAFSASRWNLRRDSAAQQVLDRIAEGEGVADLVADLEDLGALVTDRQPAFANDKTFDVVAKAAALRGHAAEVRVGLSEFRTNTAQQQAVELREGKRNKAVGLGTRRSAPRKK